MKLLACDSCGHRAEPSTFPDACDAWYCPCCGSDESALTLALVVEVDALHDLDAASLAVAEFAHDCAVPHLPLGAQIHRVWTLALGDGRFRVWVNVDSDDAHATAHDLETILAW